MRKLTTEEFIEKARSVHGDKYDYFKVKYVDAFTKVCITCPVHGDFLQAPHHHFAGRGCPKCGNIRTGQSCKLSHEEQVAAITEANPFVEVLGEITGSLKKVLCRCKTCNREWEVRPDSLKRGSLCPECKKQKFKLPHEKQIEAIWKKNPNIEILGDITGNHKKVLCLCKVCGYKWEATPANLKSGYGCPKCADHGFLTHDRGNLYIMVDDLEIPTMMKIGVSVDTEKRRDNVLRSAKKAGAGITDLYVIKTWCGPTENMHSLEQAMHQALSQYKINFPMKFDGCQEFFYYRPEVFGLVEEHLKKLSKQ